MRKADTFTNFHGDSLEKSRITSFDFLKRRGEIGFSIFDLRHIRKLSHFLTGMIHFFIFTAKKELIFSRVHATLEAAVSVGRLVGRSVGRSVRNFFEIWL